MLKKQLSFLLLLAFVLITKATMAQAVADPQAINVYQSAGNITVDGSLSEGDWFYPMNYIKYKVGGAPSGNFENTPSGFAVVKGPYNDSSTAIIKFLKKGMNLYIGITSNDKQVCRFGDSWEGDGIFMKIKNAASQDIEYKLYYNRAGVNPDVNYEGPTHSMGASVKGPGTIVNDSTNVDGGYTMELMIRLDSLGFASNVSSVQVLINIFDPDNYSDGVGAWGPNGNYAKQWWGSEWGPGMRTLNFVPNITPVELTSFTSVLLPGAVRLDWATASEINNNGFEIQRAEDGVNFTTISFINGKGTTTERSVYSYTDNSVKTGINYTYRLKQIDMDGRFAYSSEIQSGSVTPQQFNLNQNYPNPFNPSTLITFSLPVKSDVTLEVYNIAGQLVKTLAAGNYESGIHSVNFNAEGLTSGLYIYSLKAAAENGETFSSVRKMTLLK